MLAPLGLILPQGQSFAGYFHDPTLTPPDGLYEAPWGRRFLAAIREKLAVLKQQACFDFMVLRCHTSV